MTDKPATKMGKMEFSKALNAIWVKHNAVNHGALMARDEYLLLSSSSWTQAEFAKHYGKSQPYISQCLRYGKFIEWWHGTLGLWIPLRLTEKFFRESYDWGARKGKAGHKDLTSELDRFKFAGQHVAHKFTNCKQGGAMYYVMQWLSENDGLNIINNAPDFIYGLRYPHLTEDFAREHGPDILAQLKAEAARREKEHDEPEHDMGRELKRVGTVTGASEIHQIPAAND